MSEVNYRRLVIGDTETTGFKENRIVSLAILVYEKWEKGCRQIYFSKP